MFVGHFGVALASKPAAPRVSLGWLFAACQLPDLLWPILVLAGVEYFRIDPGNTAVTPLAFDHYPWSHSLLMNVLEGAILGWVYFALRRDRRGALVIALLVVSHWILDWITHRPDLPLAPWSRIELGLGLWNSVPATIVIETALYAFGVWRYAQATSARDRVGRVGLWSLVFLLLVISAANIVSPPPPSVTAVAVTALGVWLFVVLAWWVDRHRTVRALDAVVSTG
jgi:membrane-bound metal-dependent hydrolase YbcI (DUF457 family)